MTPKYITLQNEQIEKDRQRAIEMAITTLEAAQANFKLEIATINRNFDAYMNTETESNYNTVTVKPDNRNKITEDPTVAQYA